MRYLSFKFYQNVMNHKYTYILVTIKSCLYNWPQEYCNTNNYSNSLHSNNPQTRAEGL